MKNRTDINMIKKQTIAAEDAMIFFSVLVVSVYCCLCCINGTGG